MRGVLFVFFFVVLMLFISCSEKVNELNVSFSFQDTIVENNFDLPYLMLENQDSIIYEKWKPFFKSSKDTFKFTDLPTSAYSLHYYNTIGREKVKNIVLSGGEVRNVVIVPDSISVDEYYDKTPIMNLEKDSAYTIEYKGGCIATLGGYYKISKDSSNIYFEAIYQKKRPVSDDEINAIKEFEAQLLAIDGYGICNSTGRVVYTIIKRNEKRYIPDNVCIWQGVNKMLRKLCKPEYDIRNDNFNSK